MGSALTKPAVMVVPVIVFSFYYWSGLGLIKTLPTMPAVSPSDSAISISDLDDPHLLKLLEFLDPASLFNIGNTSQRFRRICQDHSLPNIWARLVLRDICRPVCHRKIQTLSNHRFDQNYYRSFLFQNLRNLTEADLMDILARGLASGPQQRRIVVHYQRDNLQSKNKKTLLVNVSKTNPNSLNVQHEAFVCSC
jgi:hypothetical protein